MQVMHESAQRLRDEAGTVSPVWAGGSGCLAIAWSMLGTMQGQTPPLSLAFLLLGLSLLWSARHVSGHLARHARAVDEWVGRHGRYMGIALSLLAATCATWALLSAFTTYRGESWQLEASHGARLLAARPGSVLGFCLACVCLSLALVQARLWQLASRALVFVAGLAALFIVCGHGYAAFAGPRFPVELASSLPATLVMMLVAIAVFVSTENHLLPPMGRPIQALMIVLLAASMLLAWRAWDKAQQEADHASQEAFLRQTHVFEAQLRRRMADFERVLRDAASLVAITPELTRQDWRDYVQGLAMSETLPGVQGIAFSPRVPAARQADFVARMQSEGVPGFKIWPAPAQASTDSQELVPVTYIEPLDERNRHALGFNLRSETARRTALDCATRQGVPCATGKVVLVQEINGPVQPGFLIFMPVYERRAMDRADGDAEGPVKGYTHMPFRMYDLMEAVQRAAMADVVVDIYDGLPEADAPSLYRTPGARPARPALYQTERDFPVFGRMWTLRFQSSAGFDTAALRARPSSVRYGLAAIALLSFGLVCLMVIERSAALRRSRETADDLRQLNTLYQRQCDTLADTNLQLEAEMQARNRALREKETLLREVYHRVKNNLQVITSLLSLQSRTLPPGATREVVGDLVQRVRAMSIVHEKLYQSGDLAAVPLASYIRDLFKQLGDANAAGQRGIVIEVDVDPLEASLDTAVPLGLMLNELVSNSLKHAFPQDRGGHVHIRLRATETGGADLQVDDDGIGIPVDFDPAATRSMGLKLAVTLANQLGGELRFSRQALGGTSVHMQVAALC